MRELSIDIETYSSVDLIKSGVYAYVNAPDFKILLFGFAFDDEEIQIVDLAQGEKLPLEVREALLSKDVIKTAYNANFERTCISWFYNIRLPVEQWRCSAVAAAELGLPQTLGGVAEALGLEQKKDARGKALINYFCKPCKPTKTNGGRTVNLPEQDSEKWEIFKEYCIQDVAVERSIKKKISRFPMVESEQRLWEYDQRITDRGVRVDISFAQNAIRFNEQYIEKCVIRAKELTGLENVNSVAQLKKWMQTETGEVIDSLNKEKLKEILKTSKNEKVLEVIKLRSEMAKTSVSKYEAMVRSVCNDGRVRGLLQFYGANRTGRWAGRIVQVQNLPQNHLRDLEYARQLVAEGDYELFEMLYGNVPQTLSELIRTAFIPSEGKRFIVSDFSAIEARVIAYLADERWRLDVFNSHGKIYEASAAQMFKVPIESIKKGDPLRQKGKIAELALGYGGSVGALVSMGALDMGLEEEELPELVSAWRAANPSIVNFWYTVDRAAKDALQNKPSKIARGISFIKQSGILFVGLPSGRRLAYVKPEIGTNKFGSPSITYMGMNQTKKTWERLETFGGKLVENIVQAFARDCLAESLKRVEDKGFEVNFHVHDELIVDAPIGISSEEELSKLMGEPISWAPGLPLRADGYECNFYKKD
ncbi:MAG: DNA polymerase [Lachnospiraceae bacterium]|nr:DNA polymerase [Lachnospiraceae bacterium]